MNNFGQKLERADRFAAITKKIGFALWQIQELEGVSAQYFVLVAQAKKGMGLAAGNALEENAKRKTFGTTVHRMAKAGLLTTSLETRFTNLLSERNWLVHRSRADSRGAVHSHKEMQQLLVRLDQIANESLSLLREIGGLSEAYVKKHGVTELYISEKADELLNQWHETDAI